MQAVKIESIPKSVTRFAKFIILAYALLAVAHTTIFFYNTNDRSYIKTRRSLVEEMNADSASQTKETIIKANANSAPQSVYANSGDFPQTAKQDPFSTSKLFSGAMGPSIVHPYYSRATHVNNPKDITITTLVTNDRFPLLSRLASRYKGPISAAIHINDNSQKEEILAELKEIISSNSHVRRYVDIHLIIDNYDRQLNMWRNTAKLYARTDYIMMLDIDFYLCTDFRNEILTNDTLLQLLDNGHSALVIPAFEYILQSDGFDYRTFPKSKDALLKEVLNEKKLDMFHRSWIKGHSATNYRKWYGADQVYKVDDYDFSYEPYVIYKRKGSPWCDERFIGYGANKAACLYEMYISGIDYYVLPDDFLIHQSHDYPETTRRKERSFNRKIYANFREEICLRYARQFMANGEWDTSLANNAKSACGRIKEFNHVIKNINQ